MVGKENFAMSEKRRGSSRVDKQETPDSTTQFFEGEEVFVVQSSDQFILGEIKEIDLASEKCLIYIDKEETLWALFKDLEPWKINIDLLTTKCNLCRSTESKKNNVVVECEICCRGYHQKCHEPIIDSASTSWICKKCRKLQNCQLLANTVTQKTVSSTSKDPSLPQSYEDITCNGKKRYCRSILSIQTCPNSFKGQKVCIKSASPSCYADVEQRKNTSKVKKRSPVENKTSSASSTSDAPLPELPPTPPSSISAPETPQPSIVNGEQPTSPTEDVTCADFSDSSPPTHLAACSLHELFADSNEPPSDITLPLQLNHVIVDPLVRPTKRHLSEKDFKIVNGVVVTVKKRRRYRRQSSAGVRAIDASLPSTSQLYKGGSHSAPHTPVKTLPNGAAADLKKLVYGYFGQESKLATEGEVLDRFVSGEEYRICGKRRTLDGRVQYLVEWVKCIDPL